ncbi:hypothetical protein C8J56DRAFT_1157003 [Mycena floridula]|nr:hypothetical protein C8J56DRAFT_1157003 [Mycena floridula]
MLSSQFPALLHDTFRFIIPEPQNRIPFPQATIPYLCSNVPFVLLAYLARRPHTYAQRLAVLPFVIASTTLGAFRYAWQPAEIQVYNWGMALLAEVIIAKSLEFALTPEGMLKTGESKPGLTKGKGVSNGHVNGDAQRHLVKSNLQWLSDAFELIHTCRGLDFKFGHKVYIPPEERPLERGSFIRATLWLLVKNFLILDFLETALKLFPGVGTPSGGTIFYPSLPPIQRYAVSTVIHMMTGTALLAGFHMCYHLITLLAVTILNSSPKSWPPVMGNPWRSESMHDLWAKDWHQLLRQTFLVFGGYPGRKLAGYIWEPLADLGMLLGTFIASGLFHELSTYAFTSGSGFDHTVTVFFASQGPILVGEKLWRKFTGRRVGGIYGRLWVYSVMFIGAQCLVDSWHKRGLGGGMIIPPLISPARYLFPLISIIVNRK